MIVGVLLVFLGARSIIGKGKRLKSGPGITWPNLVTGFRANVFGVFCLIGAIVAVLPYCLLLFHPGIDVDRGGATVISEVIGLIIAAYGFSISVVAEVLAYSRGNVQKKKKKRGLEENDSQDSVLP